MADESTMSQDGFDYDTCEMRREFAKLLHKNPEAFDRCVKEYNRFGPRRFPPLPATGGRLRKPDEVLAALLAHYRYRQGNGVTQDEFLVSEAAAGIRAGTLYQSYNWQGEEAIRTALKDARKRAEESSAFRDRLEFYEFAYEAIGGPRG